LCAAWEARLTLTNNYCTGLLDFREGRRLISSQRRSCRRFTFSANDIPVCVTSHQVDACSDATLSLNGNLLHNSRLNLLELPHDLLLKRIANSFIRLHSPLCNNRAPRRDRRTIFRFLQARQSVKQALALKRPRPKVLRPRRGFGANDAARRQGEQQDQGQVFQDRDGVHEVDSSGLGCIGRVVFPLAADAGRDSARIKPRERLKRSRVAPAPLDYAPSIRCM